jgi:hypothetical protein
MTWLYERIVMLGGSLKVELPDPILLSMALTVLLTGCREAPPPETASVAPAVVTPAERRQLNT